MAAPILWTPGKMRPFCRKNHVHKIPRFRGGILGLGGGECRFYFYGREDFSENFIVMEFPKNNSVFGQFSVKFPPPQPPPKRKFY